MKIRTDFVTNSSSSCFITVKIKSPRMQELLELETEDELNEIIDRAIYSLEDWFQGPHYFSSYSEFLIYIFQFAGGVVNIDGEELDPDSFDEDGEEFDSDSFDEDVEEMAQFKQFADALKGKLTDKDLQSGEINFVEFMDSGYGPFKYYRFNGEKSLSIYVDQEEYNGDAYKGEDISGMEFYFVGGMDEFVGKEDIVDCINTRGGTISDTITDKTDYAVCVDFEKNASELNNIRAACIPILSERAFRYRYMDGLTYDDIRYMADEVQDMTVCEWFEKYGFGDAWRGSR